MEAAKIFTNGGSQAVRLPKSCRFHEGEVLVHRIGSIVMLIPRENRWQGLIDSLPLFTDDFLSMETDDLPLEEREVFL